MNVPDLSDGWSEFSVENGTPFAADAARSPLASVIVQGSKEGPAKVRVHMSVAGQEGRRFVYATFADGEVEELIEALRRARTFARRNAPSD